jgi:hypothetical protein
MRRHVIRVWRLERRPASLNRRTSSTSVEDFQICVELRWRLGEHSAALACQPTMSL